MLLFIHSFYSFFRIGIQVLFFCGNTQIRDKLPLIMNLLDKVDEMIVSGAMAYTFLRVIKVLVFVPLKIIF